MSEQNIIQVLDEQASVGFTGRVNALSSKDSRVLGVIEFEDGEILNTRYNSGSGLKAFYNYVINALEAPKAFRIVVEPELSRGEKRIHFPYSVLKRKVLEVAKEYQKSKALRPPDGVKLYVKPEFISSGQVVTGEEFETMKSIAEYNHVKEIYKKCDLPDYQITNALVSLRKKNALSVVKKG